MPHLVLCGMLKCCIWKRITRFTINLSNRNINEELKSITSKCVYAFYICRCLGTKISLWQYWFAVICLGLKIPWGQNAKILTTRVWKFIVNTLLVCMWWAWGFRAGIVRLETEPNVTETWISELEVSWNPGFVSGSLFLVLRNVTAALPC